MPIGWDRGALSAQQRAFLQEPLPVEVDDDDDVDDVPSRRFAKLERSTSAFGTHGGVRGRSSSSPSPALGTICTRAPARR